MLDFARGRRSSSPTRRRLSLHVLLACLVAMFVLTGAAAGGVVSLTATKALPELRIGYPFPSTTFNPALDASPTVQASISGWPLITPHTDGHYSPGLALSWKYKPGNKVFTMNLRKNARFSDGQVVDAEAIKTFVNYFVASKGPLSNFLGPIRSIDTIGKWTVRLTLATPNPSLPYYFSTTLWAYPVSPNAIANPSAFAKGTFGAGAYTLLASETVVGDHYTYVPNKFF